MADFTDDQIKAARALCESATPGPWIEQLGFPRSLVGVTCDEALEVCDAEFIAAARTLFPAALDALEQARRERDEALAIADTRREHAIDNKSRADEADLALVAAKADLAATKAALAEAIALLEQAHDYRDDLKIFAACVAALKAKVQP